MAHSAQEIVLTASSYAAMPKSGAHSGGGGGGSGASREDGAGILAYDLRSGQLLRSYRPARVAAQALCVAGGGGCTGEPGAVVGAAVRKPAVSAWLWGREHVASRSITRERLLALTASPCGTFLAGGALSGNLYLWHFTSGKLYQAWNGHYKKVTTLAFTQDGSLLITGAEDALVQVWSLARLLSLSESSLASSSDGTTSVPPLRSWSGHTLPITDVKCGLGGAHGRVYTSSLDFSVKVWDLIRGTQLMSVVFPAAITCIQVNTIESMLFAGGSDGHVYRLDLQEHRSLETGSYESDNQKSKQHSMQQFVGHKMGVTQVGISVDGSLLISASLDKSVRVWDVHSCQTLRVLSSDVVVDSLLVLPKPVELDGVSSSESILSTGTLNPLSRHHVKIAQQNQTQDHEYLEVFLSKPPSRKVKGAAEPLEDFSGNVEAIRHQLRNSSTGSTAMSTSVSQSASLQQTTEQDDDAVDTIAHLQQRIFDLEEREKRWQRVSTLIYEQTGKSIVQSLELAPSASRIVQTPEQPLKQTAATLIDESSAQPQDTQDVEGEQQSAMQTGEEEDEDDEEEKQQQQQQQQQKDETESLSVISSRGKRRQPTVTQKKKNKRTARRRNSNSK